MNIFKIISLSSLIFVISCSSAPKYKDDPDYWIFKLKEYEKSPSKNIDNIISIYKETNNDLVKVYVISLLKEETSNPKVLDIVLAELSNPNKRVLLEAVKALGNSKSNAVSSKLIELLYKDIDPEIKGEVCKSLASLQDNRALTAMIDMLHSNDQQLLLSCAYSLHILTGIPLKNGKTIKSPTEWLELIKR
jgi:HEAT repeat protein